MIVSASRRTDIPAFYSQWFLNRLRAGSVCVRNPYNSRRVSQIDLCPHNIDCFVFWTKNPAPMLAHLDALREYSYYFQVTLNPYGTDIEPGVPSKRDVVLPAFKALSGSIGPARVLWRYDPVLLGGRYTVEYHIQYFARLAHLLHGFTERCTISFLDPYRHTAGAQKSLALRPPDEAETHKLAESFAQATAQNGIALQTCAEEVDLSQYGITHAACIDAGLIARITGRPLNFKKDPNQRPACGCAQSMDIGAYGTCPAGCRYCYANRGAETAARNLELHDPASPLLVGSIAPGDIVTQRKI